MIPLTPFAHTLYTLALFTALVSLWWWVKRRRRMTEVVKRAVASLSKREQL